MPGRSTCPECGTILRVRDRSFVGRRVGCPECKVALRITTEDEHGDFVVRRLTPDEVASSAHPGRISVDRVKDKVHLTTRSFLGRLIESPLTAAWLIAIAISSLIAVLALAPKYRFKARPASSLITPDDPVPAISKPDLLSISPTELPDAAAEITPEPTIRENDVELPPVTALEPTNLDGPLPWPPVAMEEGRKERSAEVVAPPAKIDRRKNLELELVSYKQSKPVSRRDLIEALQEHLGAKIRYDNNDLGIAELDKAITFELENTTVGAVLKKVTDSAGWRIVVEENGLLLRRD